MKLRVRAAEIETYEPIVLLHGEDALQMGVGTTDRVRIEGGKPAVCIVSITDVPGLKGTIAMPHNVLVKCSLKDGDEVDVSYCPLPPSIRSIRRKINGVRLEADELDSVVWDIYHGNLSEKEILAFVSAFNVNNSDIAEVAFLTRSMAATGQTVDLVTRPVFDFHSLGGIPGNKITPIVVSIVASEGLVIPKMSSRAVSSACGTADFIDTFCDVEMDAGSLAKAIGRAGGVFACGNEDYAPVGRMIIDAERPMGIDPRPMMMASIMSKKVAVGTTHLLVDIPLGSTTKTPDLVSAKDFARDIRELGSILGIHVECAVTRADQPLGRAIGPILEAKECIEVLEGRECDPAVVDKACSIAGIILEMAGESDGKKRALEILRSGQAHEKFLQIVKVQGGDPELRSDDLKPGRYVKDVHAKRTGYVDHIDNRSIVAIAKATGAPGDVEGGIELLHKVGDMVSEGDVLFRIYAGYKSKLDRAVETARSRRPMAVTEAIPGDVPENVLIERIPSKEMLDLIRFRN